MTVGLSWIVDRLLANWNPLAQAFFLGFFGLALVAVLFHRYAIFRKLYVGMFFVCLVVVSVTAIHPFPLDDLHKFSMTPSDEEEIYKTYVVDDSGNQLRLDRRVVPGFAPPPPPYPTTSSMMATRCSKREAKHVGQYLLARATDYRERLVDGGTPFEWAAFPRHHIEDQWTPTQLEKYGEFTTLETYMVSIKFEQDSYVIQSQNRTRILTVQAPQNGSDASIPGWVSCSVDD